VVEEGDGPEDPTAALSNVTVESLVAHLSALSTMYNRREVSRELAVIDLMMEKLEIGAFFPAMGEAMAKALEANTYIGTRIDEILSKIRSALGEQEFTPGTGPTGPPTPLQSNLQAADEEDARRKEQRKKRDMDRADQREAQQTEKEEALAGPVAVEAPAAPAPAAPEPAPAPAPPPPGARG